MLNLRVGLLNLWRYNRAILGVADPADGEFAVPVSLAAPLPVTVVSGGSAPDTAPLVSLSRSTVTMTAQVQALPAIPAGARAARVAVEGGAVRIATCQPQPTPTDGERWGDGTVWEVSGPDLLNLRVVAASGAPTLHVTYLGDAPSGGGL
ncbi:hypothetical protein [Deinococcus murrayi]|uniref:hypothetical protein n=1 Tax=Deinococcus murrayi TaxID=68910 RepID=UPI0004878494|nr:hypothetical protein [Deinococcus murrayi]